MTFKSLIAHLEAKVDISVCRTLNTCLTRNKNLSDTIVEFRSHQTPEIISSIAQ